MPYASNFCSIVSGWFYSPVRTAQFRAARYGTAMKMTCGRVGNGYCTYVANFLKAFRFMLRGRCHIIYQNCMIVANNIRRVVRWQEDTLRRASYRTIDVCLSYLPLFYPIVIVPLVGRVHKHDGHTAISYHIYSRRSSSYGIRALIRSEFQSSCFHPNLV